jgi:antitoxin component YwqK of YwqJK toxin-antitoxin module
MNIDINDIEIMNPDEGGGSVYWYQGQPFTGTIVEYKNNILVAEISVVDSHTEGRVAFYYYNGQIKQEYFEKYNDMYGIYRRWDESGKLVKEIDYGAQPFY